MNQITTVDVSQALARGYCHPENASKTLDPELIECMMLEVMQLIVPEEEKWLFKNKEAYRSVQRGLNEAK